MSTELDRPMEAQDFLGRMSSESEKSTRTKKLLICISRHLSGRKDCRQVEYVVHIDEESFITCLPNVHVFPDRHDRSKFSRSTIISHCITHHFQELLKYPEFGVDTDKLVTGTYKYQLSANKKRRRWIRID